MHITSGRGLALALIAASGAFLTVGCSSSNDDSSGSEDSGAGSTEDSAVASDDSGGTISLDGTLPSSDAGHDGAAPTGTDSGQDSGESTSKDAGTSDAGSDAGEHDAGQDAGNPGALPAAVAIWEFNDAPGSTTATDSSGNGHTATLMGTAAIVGAAVPDAGADDAGDAGGTEDGGTDAAAADAGASAWSNYLQIDGTAGAYADVTGGPLFDNSKDFTVATWVSFPSFNYNYDELISADGAHASVFELQLAPLTYADGGSSYNAEAAFPTTDVPTPGAFYYAFSTAPPQVTTWYHVVGVYDVTVAPGLLSLYVNGVLQSNVGDSRQTGASPVAAVGDFIIGAGKYNDTRTNGAVANYKSVRVYAAALTAAQITTLYGLGNGL